MQLRETLCQRIETLLEVTAEELETAERELNRVQGEWRSAAAAPKREAEALQKRFTTAGRRFAERKRALEDEREQATLTLLRSKAALCHQAESALHAEGAAQLPSESASSLRERWSALAALPGEDDEARMAARFETALALLEAPSQAAAPNEQAAASNLDTREALCLRMEIAAGIESPPEYAQARMAQQVARLAAAFEDRGDGGDQTPEELLHAWCLCGPAPHDRAVQLEARFERAWLAFAGAKAPDDG